MCLVANDFFCFADNWRFGLARFTTFALRARFGCAGRLLDALVFDALVGAFFATDFVPRAAGEAFLVFGFAAAVRLLFATLTIFLLGFADDFFATVLRPTGLRGVDLLGAALDFAVLRTAVFFAAVFAVVDLLTTAFFGFLFVTFTFPFVAAFAVDLRGAFFAATRFFVVAMRMSFGSWINRCDYR